MLLIMLCQIYCILKNCLRETGTLFYCEKCEAYGEIHRKCSNMLCSECLDSPQNSSVEIQLPRRMVLGNEDFGGIVQQKGALCIRRRHCASEGLCLNKVQSFPSWEHPMRSHLCRTGTFHTPDLTTL